MGKKTRFWQKNAKNASIAQMTKTGNLAVARTRIFGFLVKSGFLAISVLPGQRQQRSETPQRPTEERGQGQEAEERPKRGGEAKGRETLPLGPPPS